MPERLPVELLVGVEPPATDGGPVEVLPEAEFTEPTGAPRPVVGGGSFNVAGTLDGSGSYTDTVQRNEYVFYRVRLDWGQGLAYRVSFGETPGRGLDNVSPVSTRLFTPTRQEIEWDFSAYTGTNQVLPTSDPAIASVPVRYGNRNADDAEFQPQSVAGWYYISVQVNGTQAGAPAAPVPIQLDVTVTGTPEPGPQYAGPQYAGPTDPFTAEGTPATEPVQVSADEAAATRSAITPTGWVVIGAGAALVVVVGVLVVRLTGTRRRG